jgi:hypothetical protein
MFHARRAAIAATMLLLSSQVAAAQSGNEWSFSATPYFWMAGIKGDVGVGPLATNTDLSFSDIVKILHFGVMGTVEGRKKSYVLSLDGFYISVGDGKTIAFRGDTGVFTLNQQELMLQPSAGYTFGGKTWAVDALASIRFWHLRTTLNVDLTRRPSNQRGGTQNWVDAIGGLRGQWMPIDGWRLFIGGDGGGGGSDGTWQAYGGVGADITKHWTLSAAYRALGVNYDTNTFLYDVTMQGAQLSASFRW